MAPWGSFARAICTRRGERSRPVTRAPRAANTRARNPSPQPASSTSRSVRSPRRSSMRQRMASRSRSACSRRATNWPYSAAYSSHGLAFDSISSHLIWPANVYSAVTAIWAARLRGSVPQRYTIRPWKQHGRHPRNAAEDGATPFDIVMEGETPDDNWEQAIATVRPPHRGGPHLVPETHVRQSVVRPWLAGDAHMHRAGATSYRLYQCQGESCMVRSAAH